MRGGEEMEAIIRGTPEELATLVRATQERRYENSEVPADIIQRVVRSTIDDMQRDTASQ